MVNKRLLILIFKIHMNIFLLMSLAFTTREKYKINVIIFGSKELGGNISA